MINFYHLLVTFINKVGSLITKYFGYVIFVIVAIFIFLTFPIFKYVARFLIIPMTYFKQSKFIVLPDKFSTNNLEEKLIDSNSENITLIFAGNIAYIDSWENYFYKYFVVDDVFSTVKGTKFIMASYYDLTNNWTQEKIREWIFQKIQEVEVQFPGKVVNFYGHSMGGFFASEAYFCLQKQMNEEQKEELEKNNHNKLIVDRSFQNLNPLASRIFFIPEKGVNFLLKKLNCQLVNSFFSTNTEYEEIINPANLTFIEDIYDFIIPNKFQIGSYWRMKMQKKEMTTGLKNNDRKTNHFLLRSKFASHFVGFNSKNTVYEKIDIYGKPL